jgi:hypothetical protein
MLEADQTKVGESEVRAVASVRSVINGVGAAALRHVSERDF